MTEKLTTRQQVQKREQYTKWMNRSVVAGCMAFFVSMAVWIVTDQQPVLFAGLGLYWLRALGMGAGDWYSPVAVRTAVGPH